MASTCSGIGIQLVTIWQSKTQIDDAYATLGDSVLTNHGTKIFFSGISDPSTLDYVSRLLGEEEVVQRGSSADLDHGRRSVNESATRLRLIPSDVLRQAPPGDALLIHGTLPPAHLKCRFYYAEKNLRALAGEDAVNAAARSLAPPAPSHSETASGDAVHSDASVKAPRPPLPVGLSATTIGGPSAADDSSTVTGDDS